MSRFFVIVFCLMYFNTYALSDLFPYEIKNSTIFYHDTQLSGVDLNTFEVFRLPKTDLNATSYGKDKNHIYTSGEILHNRDLETFKVLNWGYTQDKNGVYEYNEKILGIDSSYIMIDSLYGKDINNVFYDYEIVQGADSDTFSTFGSSQAGFGYDKSYLYAWGEKLFEIDGNSIQSVGKGYFKDKNQAYYVGNGYDKSQVQLIIGLDIETFDILSNKPGYEIMECERCYYSYDKKSFYFKGEKITKGKVEEKIKTIKRVKYGKISLTIIILFLGFSPIFLYISSLRKKKDKDLAIKTIIFIIVYIIIIYIVFNFIELMVMRNF